MKKINIIYKDETIEKIKKIDCGDWIDLRAAEDVELKAGEFKLINLGVAMQLPKGYEANIVPRSSTFKNYGILMANSVGCIDQSYCGDSDQWMMPVYATRDVTIHINDRIAQFKLEKKQDSILFKEVEHFDNPDRGGIGSTGVL